MKTITIIKKSCLLFIITLMLSSCGATIVTCKRTDADIFVDGVCKGKGTVKIKRIGVPHKAQIIAQVNNTEIGSIKASRKFDAVTLLAGLCTYYSGFIWAWRYPSVIEVPVFETFATESIWLKPPSGNLK
ncbi:MAG: hypothetical protein WCK02_03800 [Bacteroidota bacterium]